MVSERKIKIKGNEINILTAGNQKNIPAIFLHGGGTFFKRASKLKSKFIKELSKHFFVFAPELPGFFKTPIAKSCTMNDYYKYTEEIINYSGFSEFILIGQSFGARLAVNYATKNSKKIKLLVLGNPAVFFNDIRFDLAFLSGHINIEKMPNYMKKLIIRSALATYNIENLKLNEYVKVVRLLPLLPETNFNEKLKNCKIKTLIFWGNLDPLISKNESIELHHRISDSQFINLTLSHPAMISERKKTIKIILSNIPYFGKL